MRMGNCSFPTFAGLTADQQALFGGTAAQWGQLDSKQIAGFLNITGALSAAGVDLSGLGLQPGGIHQDRLLFTPESAATLQSRMDNTVFSYDQPRQDLHPEMASWGARQNVLRYALQVGTGPGGAFVDIDLWNPSFGLLGSIMHGREVLENAYDRRRGGSGLTNPSTVGKGLGSSVTNYTCH